jgi:hypothetical protein
MDTAVSTEAPVISVGTHSFPQRYLYAFATQAEVLHHIRTQAIEDEQARLSDIMVSWQQLQPCVAGLAQSEAGESDTIRVQAVPDDYQPQLQAFAADMLFQKTFSHLLISFALVEVDKLVAPQRTVNLDYTNRLLATYPSEPTLCDLLNICVSPHRAMDPIQHLEIGPNTHVFSSPNSDIRFLGAFVKHLSPADLDFAVSGGLPAAAVIAFVGYGGAPVNVLQAGQRYVLNNGFHRVYALRSLGIREIPVVVQHVQNVELAFPQAVAGLPREYLLRVPRPVLIKDFFESDFAITLRVRERIKIVTVGISLGQHDVPS